MLYSNLCYNETCYKGAELYLILTCNMVSSLIFTCNIGISLILPAIW